MSALPSGQGGKEVFPVQEAAFPSGGRASFRLSLSSSHMHPVAVGPPSPTLFPFSVCLCGGVCPPLPPVTAVTVQGWDVPVWN